MTRFIKVNARIRDPDGPGPYATREKEMLINIAYVATMREGPNYRGSGRGECLLRVLGEDVVVLHSMESIVNACIGPVVFGAMGIAIVKPE